MELRDVKFSVIITFDITVGERKDIYSAVSELLANNGFAKESYSGNSLPENIYHGVLSKKVEVDESDHFTVKDLNAASASINKRVVELLEQFFDSENVPNNIFVHVSRQATSSTTLN